MNWCMKFRTSKSLRERRISKTDSAKNVFRDFTSWLESCFFWDRIDILVCELSVYVDKDVSLQTLEWNVSIIRKKLPLISENPGIFCDQFYDEIYYCFKQALQDC